MVIKLCVYNNFIKNNIPAYVIFTILDSRFVYLVKSILLLVIGGVNFDLFKCKNNFFDFY